MWYLLLIELIKRELMGASTRGGRWAALRGARPALALICILIYYSLTVSLAGIWKRSGLVQVLFLFIVFRNILSFLLKFT